MPDTDPNLPVGPVDASGQPADVSNLPLPEQPPMLDDETDEQTPVEDTSTDDLSVQGGD